MTKWLMIAIVIAGIFMGVQTLRADDVLDFANVTCKGSTGEHSSKNNWPILIQGYFHGVRFEREIQETYPERYDYFLKRCNEKRLAKALLPPEQLPKDWDQSSRYLSIEVEMVKVVRGEATQSFAEACTMNADCKSDSCDLRLGKCNLKFTIPALSVAQ